MRAQLPLSKIPGPRLRDYPRGVWDLLFSGNETVRDSETHLRAAMDWLCRAQDAGSDRGIARMYHVRDGWGASYPETTGYAIPTFLDYARLTGSSEFSRRAIEMSEWESRIQLDTGAVQGGVVTDPPSPAIFNTGQVLFGWCAAYRETKSERFRESALRAAQYLCDQQEADGSWRRNLSAFCDSGTATYAFNVRTAWALLLAGRAFDVLAFEEAASKSVDHVLSLQHENGWIEENCIGRPEQPLLHTIAYAYQGLIEIASLRAHGAAKDLVVRGNEALLANFRKHGRLHGRYEHRWQPTVRWRCLTGEAQTAIVWYRLADVAGAPMWTDAAKALLNQVAKTQRLTGTDGIRGGIKGSHPITGAYGRLEYLNWAAKFYADALMVDLGLEGAARSG